MTLRGLFIRIAVNAYGYGAMALGVTVLGILFAAPLAALGRLVPRVRRAGPWLVHRFIRLYFACFPFLRVEATGWENLPPEGGYVMIGNHASWLDTIVLISLLPQVCGAAKPYLFRVPLLATMAALGNFFPVTPGSRRDLAITRGLCEDAGREGRRILFFPEGTRSRDGKVGPFSRGAFRMAAEHGLRIQPFTLRGSGEFIRPGDVFSRATAPIRVRVRFLPGRPAPAPGSLRRAEVLAVAEEERARIVAALAEDERA
jgi:1-acyl-sn-glycerol-3-phosphate acyltransferase